ncbi:MAG: glycine cleavage system aminomethyltransferase GcvT [Planctomycetales bacterium]|nr:glycine cleavage system aminomethyltransferase GcvT [Planctomycetales bacterium]
MAQPDRVDTSLNRPHSPPTLAETPLTSWHLERGARMAEFAGFNMPIQYTTIVAEHTATRTAAGLFDISHMGRLRFEGPRAHELLDHLLTRRVTDMRPGTLRYSMMCNEDAGVLDDVLLANLETPSSRQYFLLVVNASNRPKILNWIQPHLADYPDVAFSDVTETTAMISVQGPKALPIVQCLFPSPKVGSLKYFRGLVTEQMGKPCIVSRTGYTGEDGFELIVRNEDAARVWENLMLAGREHGVEPVGLGARDTLRLEAGMPLYGHELSEHIDPFTAGLGFAVSLGERSFVGCEALTKLKTAPRPQQRVGVQLTGRRAAREGANFLDADQRVVGTVTSGTYSPTLQRPIAMGYLASELAVEGTSLEVDIRGSRTAAEIVRLPFYRR